MTLEGRIHNGVVVFDQPPMLPEGTPVRVEVVQAAGGDQRGARRQGGQYAGRIWMAPDFDQWPADLQEALGMTP